MGPGPIAILGEGRAAGWLLPTAIAAQTLDKLRACLILKDPCLWRSCGLLRDAGRHLAQGPPEGCTEYQVMGCVQKGVWRSNRAGNTFQQEKENSDSGCLPCAGNPCGPPTRARRGHIPTEEVRDGSPGERTLWEPQVGHPSPAQLQTASHEQGQRGGRADRHSSQGTK